MQPDLHSRTADFCASVHRRSVHDQMLLQVAPLESGDPNDSTTVVGPLIDQQAAQRVEEWIGEAVSQGARILLGGKRMGAVVDATVLEM